jgi:hypothetical protein
MKVPSLDKKNLFKVPTFIFSADSLRTGLCADTKKTRSGKIIWDYLINTLGLTEEGAAGLMGNFRAESSQFESAIYQNEYKSQLGLTNQKYVDKVNDGTYNNFTDDRVGFGIAQWTLPFRKANLLNKCKGKIGDLNCQLDFVNMN